MISGVYFIAGIYGTGKTTVGKEIARRLGIPCYEASELIKKHSGEEYGATKHVKDIKNNQDILAAEVAQILKTEQAIVLTGHFAVFDKERQVEPVPYGVFEKLRLAVIILLEADIDQAMKRLSERDKKDYTGKELSTLATAEKRLCTDTATRTGTRLITHKMNYTNDAETLEKLIREEDKQ